MKHGHSHVESGTTESQLTSHQHVFDAPPQVRRAAFASFALIVLVGIVAMFLTWPASDKNRIELGYVFENATVLQVQDEQECVGVEVSAATPCQTALIELTSGQAKGEQAIIELRSTEALLPRLEAGDKIVVSAAYTAPLRFRYQFAEFQRGSSLLLLAIVFVLVVLAIGRIQGLRAIAGTALSLLVLVFYMIPAIAQGTNAVIVSTVGVIVIGAIVLLIAHGPTLGTVAAFAGTIISLGVTIGLGWAWVELAQITGLADDSINTLRFTNSQLSAQGLLLAGIVIGALGALDDITVTQVATIGELRRANAALTARELYQRASRVGRDHISSIVNTLVLAYAGASLGTLVILTELAQPMSQVLAKEVIAVEIIRTLVGSIGLIVAVPITTGIAVLLANPPRELAGNLSAQVNETDVADATDAADATGTNDDSAESSLS